MRKILLGCFFLSLCGIVSAGTYKAITETWKYNAITISYEGPTTKWLKNNKIGTISYDGPTVHWKKTANGNTKYTTPTTTLERNGDNIKYTTPTTTYEKKGGDIIYKTPTTTLIISKDKIKYTTPTTNREINGGDWKYTTPTSKYNN